MTRYRIRLRHDRGSVVIHITAESIAKAIEQVLRSECAPESAIRSIIVGRKI